MSTTLATCLTASTTCGPVDPGAPNVTSASRVDTFRESGPLAPRAPLELSGGRRDDARLLVAARTSGQLTEARMADLTSFLGPGDVLVVNTSGTLPAAVEVDDQLVVHLSTELEPARPQSASPTGSHVESTWVVELRHLAGQGSTPWLGYRPTAPVSLPAGAVLEILGPYTPNGRAGSAEATRLWTARLSLPRSHGRAGHLHAYPPSPTAAIPTAADGVGNDLLQYLATHGRPIRYGNDAQPWPLPAYQTIFAVEPGSAEMPSAGRGFTAELVTDLVRHGVTIAPIVLHTGVASQEAGEMPYPERYRVPPATAAAVNAARSSRRRVIAVGTTATRAIETAAERNGGVVPSEGWTDLVITPERGVRAVNGLLTGWHDPEASHLMLVEAVAGREILDRSYKEAVAAGFAGHEFGDFHLVLP